jgi:hypothetical protein
MKKGFQEENCLGSITLKFVTSLTWHRERGNISQLLSCLKITVYYGCWSFITQFKGHSIVTSPFISPSLPMDLTFFI